jgi:hypothetical protein
MVKRYTGQTYYGESPNKRNSAGSKQYWMKSTNMHVSLNRTSTTCYVSKHQCYKDRNSTVDIATRYGLDGPGIESRWGPDFPHPPRTVLGPTQSPIQWVPGLTGGKAAGTWYWKLTPSSADVKERVQLFLWGFVACSKVNFTFIFYHYQCYNVRVLKSYQRCSWVFRSCGMWRCVRG